VAVSVSTTFGSSTVTITDTTVTGVTAYDAVYIRAHISVGGIVLFGSYPTTGISTNTYTITATDVLGNPLPATSTVTNGGAVASFATAITTNVVTVTLNNHGYSVGSTYPVLVSTPVGGITLYGNYIVQSVTSANVFTIYGSSIATATATASINGGNAAFTYNFGVGAVVTGTGYGIAGYGIGGYGTGVNITAASGSPVTANDWVLDNWGQVLISCAVNGTQYQPLYQYDPTSGSPNATIIPQGPMVNEGMFVAMPQRQIIAYGSSFNGVQDPLLIRWCDVNNYSSWIAQVTNQAGSYRIPKGSKIVGGFQGPAQSLIWTDLDVWAMNYIGQPNIYGFNEIGSGCGLIAKKAVAALQGDVYWMGPSQFFKLGASGVQPLPCPIWDVVYQNLDSSNASKIRVAVNSRFNEVAWYYPTTSSGGEVSAYIKYNALINEWDYGTLARSAWIDQSVLGPPIGADPNLLYIYQHETSNDADGAAMTPSFQSGYFALSEGEDKTFVDQFWPDFKWGQYNQTQNASIKITFNVADYPGQTPAIFGPYTVTQASTYISTRFRGKLVSILVSGSDTGSFWRIGNMRYRYQVDGRF
jgi:hypothetical protein